ncbi:MAG: hypothetical protein Q4D91_13435 [Lautropia sp.]|nr:hypothetical protein [Lautropia sp.]
MSNPLIISVEAVEVGVWFDRLLVLLVLVLMAAAWWLETPYNLVWVGVFAALAWGVPRWLHGPQRAAEAARLRHQAMQAVDAASGRSRRHDPASLCAQARSPMLHKPWALRFSTNGQLACRWTADAPWVVAFGVQSLWLGPLVHLRFQAPFDETPVPASPAGPRTPAGACGRQMAHASLAERAGGQGESATCPASDIAEPLSVSGNVPPAGGVESGRIDPIPYAAPTSTESAADALMATASPQPAGEALRRHASCLLWMPRLPAEEAAALRRWLLWRQRGGH